IISDEVNPADAVVVLGGGTATRPFAAAQYYKLGLVKKILVSNVRLDRSQTLGGLLSPTDLNRVVISNLGVPEAAIENFGSGLSNTYEEVVALREWAARNQARSVIVPTEIFSTRRVRWILSRELSAAGTQFEVPAVEDADYTSANWWKNEKGVVTFQNEIIKYV